MLGDSNKSLPEVTSERIIEYILANGLAAGELLPNETRLGEMLGVSRSTLREACRMLVSRNILETRQGSGTFVCVNTGISTDPLGFTFIKDKKKLAADLVEFRMWIEPRIAALAADNATPEGAAELAALADGVEQALLGGRRHSREDALFHTKLAELSGNVIMPNLQPIIAGAIDLFIEVTKDAVLAQETISTHRAVVEAVKAGNAMAAHDAMTLHLMYNRVEFNKLYGKVPQTGG